MKTIILKLFLIVFVLTSMNLYSQSEVKLNKYLRNILINENQDVNVENKNLTLIFWIRDFACTPCVITAVNYNNVQIKNKFSSQNSNAKIKTITVIDSDLPDDVKIYKRKFKTDYFFIDTAHFLNYNYFKKDVEIDNLLMCSLLIFETSGELIYKKNNFHQDPPSLDSINHIIIPVKDTMKCVLNKSIPLIENDSIIITKIEDYNFNKNINTLTILDYTLNRILLFSTISGELLNIISPPEEYAYHFANMKDTNEEKKWRILDTLFDELVHFQHFLINGTDTLAVIELYDKIEIENDTTTLVYRGYYWFKKKNNSFELIKDGSFYSAKDTIFPTILKPYSMNTFLCKANDPTTLKDTTNSRYLFNPYEFIKLNTQNWEKTKFFKYKDFNPEYTGPDDYIPNITKYATNGNSEFVAFDYATKKAKVFHEDSLIAELPTDILKKYRKDEKDFIILNDLFLTKDKAALIFSKNKDDSATLQIMLIYDRKGNLLIEGTYEKVDKLMETYCLDLDDKGLILLNKWKKNRWTIDSFGFN